MTLFTVTDQLKIILYLLEIIMLKLKGGILTIVHVSYNLKKVLIYLYQFLHNYLFCIVEFMSKSALLNNQECPVVKLRLKCRHG